MLRRRAITAVVLVALMIGATLWLPTPALGAFTGVFVLIGAWEWAALAGVSAPAARIGFLVLVAATGTFSYWAVHVWPFVVPPLMAAVVAWWVWALVDLLRHADVHSGLFSGRILKLSAGLIVLVSAWISLLVLHNRGGGPWIAVYVMALVWAADTGAYFTGRAFGRHKLAPMVSPGKTLEGVLGGLAVALGLTLVVSYRVLDLDLGDRTKWLIIAGVAVLFSVLGDLTESRIKRAAGVKDSGTIFPGHGGVLDRIDAFLAAAPVFTLGWIWLM